MKLYLNLHEHFFLNTIKNELCKNEKNKKDNFETNKIESIFMSGIFWVLSGLLILNKKKNLDDIIGNNATNKIYEIVMSCVEKKKVNRIYIENLKKDKYLLSEKTIEEMINNLNFTIDQKNVKNENENHIKNNDNENNNVNIFNKYENKNDIYILNGFCPCNKNSFLYESNTVSTLSAIQILILLNKSNEKYLSTKMLLHIYNFVLFLFDEKNGYFHFSFNNLKYKFDGDMRFVFCSLSILYLIFFILKKRNIYMKYPFNINQCIQWIIKCLNLDGGFSNIPKSESHAGTTFCAIYSLNYLKDQNNKTYFYYNPIIKKKIIRWLCDRFENFGINGRINKEKDVCYSWWVISSLIGLNVNIRKCFNINILLKYILNCQDKNNGGFSRKEQYDIDKYVNNFFFENDYSYLQSDQFHTFFSLCALSLIYYNVYYKNKEYKENEEYLFFDNIIIPKHLKTTLNNLQKINSFLAMPIYFF